MCKHCLGLYMGSGFEVGRTVLGPGKVRVDGIYTAFEYSDEVRSAMLRFKFNGCDFYAKTFAYGLAQIVDKQTLDVIVPVPLSEKRMDERGYNQAELIGEELSKILGVSFCADGLRKVREIPRQSKSKGEERLENVRGAFCVNNRRIAGKSILLVDDVLTTGSTLGECARVLYEAGAVHVFCATVALARRGSVPRKHAA